MKVNKKIGNNTETLIQEVLSEHGFWSTLLADKANGQPCDIVAGRNDTILLLDAKHCDKNYFQLSRMEANQQTCFELAKECGVKNTGFAVFFEPIGIIKWLPYENAKKRTKQVSYDELEDFKEFICKL